MNSRSSVNESNLVNLSANLSAIDPLDTKDSLSLSFPFDHIYACHSEGSERRQTLTLDKDVEISTHCVVTDQKDLVVSTNSEINRLTERLTAAENQNKKLKDLVIYHLDLIQQQNDAITKREKLYQALKQENDTLKSRVTRMDKKTAASQKATLQYPPPVVQVPPPYAPSHLIKIEPELAHQSLYTSNIYLPERPNPFQFTDVSASRTTFGSDPFNLNRSQDTDSQFLRGLGVSTILEDPKPVQKTKMIETKRTPYAKKDIKQDTRPEPQHEPLYTVTTSGGTPIIQKNHRNRKRASSGIGSLNRMPKTQPAKVEPPETASLNSKQDSKAGKNKKSLNTYGRSRTPLMPDWKARYPGSLCDRLKLIDTTPTGEDPYQLGEADMREQSPIPKLMLQKTNHGRMKVRPGQMGALSSTRRIYDAPATETSTTVPTIKLEHRYNLPCLSSTDIKKEIAEEEPLTPLRGSTSIMFDPDPDIIKTETDIDWRTNSNFDFVYDDSNTSQVLPRMNQDEFDALLVTETSNDAKNAADTFESLDFKTIDYCTQAAEADIPVQLNEVRFGSSFMTPIQPPVEVIPAKPRSSGSKRGRKRDYSASCLKQGKQTVPKSTGPKPKRPRGKAACRGKKSPLQYPGMKTTNTYHTEMGDADTTWYFGLDPHVKIEDMLKEDNSELNSVEVPRWREKPYTSCYTLEGTEDLDDKVFEKRHQKLEAEERRQLRWHMRRVREQRHVERLRQRQRHSWCSGLTSPAYQQPSVYTIWPQPQRDVRVIEITDTLPVMAFGEDLPELPTSEFILPWVRTSKALKRAKRSKTLHI